ncbi:MAG: EAL domain-containing protein [Gammaproteobacteria bacterium]|nr:EAL domain-containing protein [Gammaproteobacteria bacterium]
MHRSGRKSIPDLNREFSKFLGITSEDLHLLGVCHDALLQGSERFGQLFYNYLFNFAATAGVLAEYQRSGNSIDALVKKQQDHLTALLSGDVSDGNAERLMAIGKIHCHYGIEPAWIMGAYWLYLDHLRIVILGLQQMDSSGHKRLLAVVSRLLFRDMGMMLEGYWAEAVGAVAEEHKKVVDLRERVESLLSNIPQLLWSIDTTTQQPLYVSPNAYQVCGTDISMPIPCLKWTVPDDQEMVGAAWQQAVQGNRVEVESRVIGPEGRERWFRRVFQPFTDTEGKVLRVDGLLEDISESKRNREHLRRLATTDELTGLPNRTLWHDRVDQAISGARREGKMVALMLLDLNHFKEINDTLGHHIGDEILRLVGMRLKSMLRDSDTLARLGGDEFAILLPDVVNGRVDAERVASHVTDCFNEPLCHEDNELYLGAAIGITLFPDDGDDTSTLMRRADVAMYAAKQADTGFRFYDYQSDTNTTQRLQLSGDLRHALKRHEFELYFQPIISLASNRVTGAEALLRWHHPKHGLILPAEFLPAAEQTGLINALTDWVVQSAVAHIGRWREAGMELPVAVNVSTRSFQAPRLVDRVGAILGRARVPGRLLEIEITENGLMNDFERGHRVVRELHELGVSIAIDDFGTGYSSLAYLKRLPIDTLKIDRSFVIDMATDEGDATIVRSTIDLGHNLGFRVVAEGVESSHVQGMLALLGCDFAQGYCISQPVPAPEFERWLKTSPLGYI